jgi:hypothetical protein
MEKLTLSTAYFPPISWFALAQKFGTAQIDAWETYVKQSYRNRFRMATSTGIIELSVPVKKPNGNKSKSNEIQIDYSQKWQQQHWRSIQTAYQSAPFFLYYQDDIEELISTKYDSLLQMNTKIMEGMIDLLNTNLELSLTDDFLPIENDPNDFRFLIHPKKSSLLKQEAYFQVFDEKLGFIPDLSILDLLFNMGPESSLYLNNMTEEPSINIMTTLQ